MTKNLKRCPFCGGKAQPTVHLEYSWFAPVCISCGARGPSVRIDRGLSSKEMSELMSEADAKWNRRARQEDGAEMSKRTALEIALDLDAASCSSFAKLEAAESLRQQHAEIERLKRERHHIYDLLARIHRDGGQYTAENGVEKACEDAESQVTAWLDTISGVDALIEQARIAEREACAVVCDELESLLPGTKTGNMLQWAAAQIRARSAS